MNPGRKLSFRSNRESDVTIVREGASTKQTVLQTLATSRGGRMMALDSKTHTSYPATAGDVAPAAQVPGAQGNIPRPYRVLSGF